MAQVSFERLRGGVIESGGGDIGCAVGGGSGRDGVAEANYGK